MQTRPSQGVELTETGDDRALVPSDRVEWRDNIEENRKDRGDRQTGGAENASQGPAASPRQAGIERLGIGPLLMVWKTTARDVPATAGAIVADRSNGWSHARQNGGVASS